MEHVNLLDKLTEGRELPEGCDSWGIKSVHPDLMTTHDYTWPFPGQWAECDPARVDVVNTGACPSRVGDGLCVGLDWAGMASGGIPARTLLLVAYAQTDVLGRAPEKLRARRVYVVALVGGERLLREYGRNADLWSANLTNANLRGASLRGANLWSADLADANLWSADLTGADLADANLTNANLTYADLRSADLTNANLAYANLAYANLTDANLTGADLAYANLTDANLTGANLTGADLTGANLRGANNVPTGVTA